MDFRKSNRIEEIMEEKFLALAKKYDLDEEAITYLDSITWQMREGNYLFGRDFIEDIGKIALRYSNPTKALKIIDKYTKEYMKTPEYKRGSFNRLNSAEEKASAKGNLTLNGLESRIEENLLVDGELMNGTPGARPYEAYPFSDKQYHGSFVD